MAGEDVTISYGADLSSLKSALGDLKSASNAAGTTLKASLGAAALGAGAAAGAAAAIAAINGLGYAVGGTITLLRDSVVAALDSEQANIRLAKAVENAGSAFSFTFEQLKESARALQGQSIFSNEQIEAAQKVLIQYKLTGEQFRETQQLALDMAADLGQAPVEAARMLGQALADPARAMLTLRRQLSASARQQVEEQIKLGDVYGAQATILEDLQQKYKGMSAAAADTASGGWGQIVNTFNDLKATLGEAVLPYLQEIMPVAKALTQIFADWALETIKLTEAFRDSNWAEEFRSKVVDVVADIMGIIQEAILLGRVWITDLKWMASLGPAAIDVLRIKPAQGLGVKATDAERAYMDAREQSAWAREDWENFQANPQAWRDALKARMNAPKGDALGGDNPLGGGLYSPKGTSLGAMNPEWSGLGSGIASGITQALKQTGTLDSLKTGSNEQIALLAANIKKSVKDSGSDVEFKGGFEDSVSTFKRIQAAQYNVNKVEERQLTALEKLVLSENDKRTRDDMRNITLLEISGTLKNGVPTVLQ